MALVFDVEVFPDFFSVGFLDAEGVFVHLDLYEGHPLDRPRLLALLRAGSPLVSFNGTHFDLPLLSAALRGDDNQKLKKLSDSIIKNNLKAWRLGVRPLEGLDHVDLIEVAPGMASLKLYGGRLHCRTMRDLPFPPDRPIGGEDARSTVRAYCANDLRTTNELYQALLPQIKLREQLGAQYGLDLRSKSDAQIAEAVIVHEVEQASGQPLPKPDDLSGKMFQYKAPAFLQPLAQSPLPALREAYQTVTEAWFAILGNGTVMMPSEIKALAITIGGSTYRMGIGGLHSSETSVAHVADDDTLLLDRDVASYYPEIILQCGIEPPQMKGHFTRVYRQLVERRLAAKRAGDSVTANVLKIVVNGTFGKLGSPYSKLYAPALLLQVTLTGQLALLMLIAELECSGAEVVSANTDGLVIRCPKRRETWLHKVFASWEDRTRFVTEETRYAALYSRDVNNYVAVKADGGAKVKGAFAAATLAKNPQNEVVTEAVLKHLVRGVPVRETIEGCADVRKFVSIRTVRGGAVKDGVEIGKAVRWYYSIAEAGTINYAVNGYTVPRTEGARPLMTLPNQVPLDVDYDWYVNEAEQVLHDIGATQ